MEKKKKTRFIVGWLLITAALLAGSLLVPGHGKSESFGPELLDIHSPRERLGVASVERMYQLVCEILKNCR